MTVELLVLGKYLKICRVLGEFLRLRIRANVRDLFHLVMFVTGLSLFLESQSACSSLCLPPSDSGNILPIFPLCKATQAFQQWWIHLQRWLILFLARAIYWIWKQRFLDHVFRYRPRFQVQDLINCVISDCSSQFISRFWKFLPSISVDI